MDLTLVPQGKLYAESFKISKANPTNRPCWIVVYWSIASKSLLNHMKFHPSVFNFLEDKGVWLKVDRFHMEEMATVGTSLFVHPHVTWYEDYTIELQDALSHVLVPNDVLRR